jgi:hypothetical protein
MSLLRTATRGLLAGAAGTIAMDLVWYVRYKRGGGESGFLKWEFASQPTEWDKAGAPAKVGKLLVETATHQPVPASQIPLISIVMHWGYGSQWGVVVALALGWASNVRPWQGPVVGTLVWLSSYVAIPIAGFYEPIWKYDLKTLWDDFSAHLVYGSGAVAAFWAACRS